MLLLFGTFTVISISETANQTHVYPFREQQTTQVSSRLLEKARRCRSSQIQSF